MHFILIVVITIFTLLPANDAAAIRIGSPIEKLVQTTDLVVMATLTNVREWTEDSMYYSMDYGSGSLVIADVIWGDVAALDSLTLSWQNRSSIACPRVEHRGSEGKELIWLLTREADGSVRADHPGRKIAVTEQDEVRRALEQYPFKIRFSGIKKSDAPTAIKPDAPIVINLVLRNATDSTISIPCIQMRNGTLEHDSGIQFDLKFRSEGESNSVSSRLGRIFPREDLPPIQLSPGETHCLNIPLRELMEIDNPGFYRLTFRIRPDGVAGDHNFTILTPHWVRRNAAEEKGELVPFLVSIIKGEEEGDKWLALNSLMFMSKNVRSTAVEALHHIFPVAEPELKQQLIQTICIIDPDLNSRLTFLLPLLSDPDPEIGLAARREMDRIELTEVSDEAVREAIFRMMIGLPADDDGREH